MFVNNILQNLKNVPGWRSSRKLVVIECDDWSGINMSSLAVYERLRNAVINVGKKGMEQS